MAAPPVFSDTTPQPRLCCSPYGYEVVKTCRYGKLVGDQFRCNCPYRCDECLYRHKMPMWPEQFHARLTELGLTLEDGEVPKIRGNYGMRREPAEGKKETEQRREKKKKLQKAN